MNAEPSREMPRAFVNALSSPDRHGHYSYILDAAILNRRHADLVFHELIGHRMLINKMSEWTSFDLVIDLASISHAMLAQIPLGEMTKERLIQAYELLTTYDAHAIQNVKTLANFLYIEHYVEPISRSLAEIAEFVAHELAYRHGHHDTDDVTIQGLAEFTSTLDETDRALLFELCCTVAWFDKASFAQGDGSEESPYIVRTEMISVTKPLTDLATSLDLALHGLPLSRVFMHSERLRRAKRAKAFASHIREICLGDANEGTPPSLFAEVIRTARREQVRMLGDKEEQLDELSKWIWTTPFLLFVSYPKEERMVKVNDLFLQVGSPFTNDMSWWKYLLLLEQVRGVLLSWIYWWKKPTTERRIRLEPSLTFVCPLKGFSVTTVSGNVIPCTSECIIRRTLGNDAQCCDTPASGG